MRQVSLTATVLKIPPAIRQETGVRQLRYTSPNEPGISRLATAGGFKYLLPGGKPLTDKDELERIRKLVIPPAWTNVWICTNPNGHLQVTGVDVRGRKQYKYHPAWSTWRNLSKFEKMAEFGEQLPRLRKAVDHDLSLHGLPLAKVLAIVVRIMEATAIRIGNAEYEKQNGSYGLTTLKDKHVSFKGKAFSFIFKVKKGVVQNISVNNKRLAKMVMSCRDLPGKELFQFIDDNGTVRPVDSGMVNDYIRQHTGPEFTAKDFRTWTGTLHAFTEICNCINCNSRRKTTEIFKLVSEKLGNTPAVCKKYYVHPLLISKYDDHKHDEFKTGRWKVPAGYTSEEYHLLQWLRRIKKLDN